MNLQPTDIIIRQTNGTESLWISQRLLMDVCGVSELYCRKSRTIYKTTVRACDLAKAKDFMPDSGKAWRWGRQNSQFYYCLANIPNKAPKFYREKFGDAENLKDQYIKACRNREETSLETRFKSHLKTVSRRYREFYTDVTENQRVALSKACAVLDFILEEKDEYPGTANKLYKDIAPILDAMDLQYVPHHYLKLKEKITILETTDQSIVDIIQLPRRGNNNAEMYNDPEVFSWVLQLRSMPQNYTNEWIIRKVSEMCEITRKRVPSRRWFGQTILEQSKTKFLTGEKRFGTSNRKSFINRSYIPQQNALFAGDCWEMDATRVNMVAHQAEDGTERYINIVAVRDVHSGDILGYSFDYSENHVVYLEAMAMAVKNTGYLPYEWIFDRFPGHNDERMKDFFERLESKGVNVVFSSSPNDKASMERWFGTLQTVFMQDSKYYYGQGIQSRAMYAHRAPEYLKRIKKEAKKQGWNLEKNIEEISDLVEKYRNTKLSAYSRKYAKVHQSPAELHEYSEKPHVNYIPASTISMLFGLRTSKTLGHNGQFTIEIVGAPFDYMISPAYFDVIANYHGKKVVITYDMNDLSVVYIWEKHGKLLRSLCDAELFERPQTKGPNKKMNSVGKAKARAQAIQELKEKELSSMIGEDAGLMGIYTEKSKINAFEDQYNNDEYREPMKKASGDGISPDDIANALLNNTSDEY